METELSLSEYWSIIRRRRVGVAVIGALVLALDAAFLSLYHPRYRAEAFLKFEPPMSSLAGGEMAAMAMGPIIQTQVSLLLSEDMRQRLAAKLKVDPAEVKGYYDAGKVGASSLISLTAVNKDPAEAAKVVNLVAELYVQWDLEMRSQKVRQTIADVQARQVQVKADLETLEAQRQSFLETHKTTGLTQAIAAQLLDLQGRRNEMERKFTDEHPDMIKIDQRIRTLAAKLAMMPAEEEELLRINRDRLVSEGTFVELAKVLETKKIEAESTVSFVSLVSPAIPPEKPYFPNKRVFAALGLVAAGFAGVFIAFVLEGLDISITTLEDIEKVLSAPVLAVIPHFGVSSKWDNFVRFIMRRERVDESQFRSILIFRFPPKSPNIEVYHAMRVNVQAQLGRPTGIVLSISSTGIAEGKTLTAINFALASAHSGNKTLLIGADVRRPTLHKIFGLPRQPGLVEVLTDRVPWRGALRSTVDILMGEQDLDRIASFPNVDNLKLMTGWSESTTDVVNILQSPSLPLVVKELRAAFDVVIFDLPPVLLFVDALLVTKHTDGLIMVYRSGKMGRRALKRAKEQIETSNGRIIGIALNDAHTAEMDPGYASYGDYGHYLKPAEK